MIRVIAQFEESADKYVELAGLSRRINVIGLQPIPGDQFGFEDLSPEDQNKIVRAGKKPVEKLVVKSRQFKFENTFSALYIFLGVN